MAFAFVNIGEGTGDLSVGTIASAAANHVAGNALIVFVQNEDSRTVSSVADLAGNTFTPRGTNSSGTARQAVWTAFPILGSAVNVVTATLSGNATFRRIRVMQYSFAGTCGFHDSDVGIGNSATPSTNNSSPTTNANAVIAACIFIQVVFDNLVAGTDFNLRGTGEGTDTAQEDRVVSSIGTYNASASNDESSNWMMIDCILVETGVVKRKNLSLLLGVSG